MCGRASSTQTMALHIQNAPLILTGLNTRDISRPVENENMSLRKPPGRFQSVMDQPTPRWPKPERLQTANAPSPRPATDTSTLRAFVGIFLMMSA